MTLPPRPTYSCLGKEQFADKSRADTVAHRIAGRSANKVSTYRCNFCHAWHVGSGLIPKGKRSKVTR